jgi:hypothetical protein
VQQCQAWDDASGGPPRRCTDWAQPHTGSCAAPTTLDASQAGCRDRSSHGGGGPWLLPPQWSLLPTCGARGRHASAPLALLAAGRAIARRTGKACGRSMGQARKGRGEAREWLRRRTGSRWACAAEQRRAPSAAPQPFCQAAAAPLTAHRRRLSGSRSPNPRGCARTRTDAPGAPCGGPSSPRSGTQD